MRCRCRVESLLRFLLSGQTPDENEARDVQALYARFGLPLPEGYWRWRLALLRLWLSWPRAKAFYGGTLGLPLEYEDDFAVVFNAHGTMLRVTPVPEMVIAGYTVLGWNVNDIELSARELCAAGVRFERFPGLRQDELGIWDAPGGTKVAWFRDPDGNILSLSQQARARQKERD